MKHSMSDVHNKKPWLVAGALGLAVILGVALAEKSPSAKVAESPIQIGFVAPLTGQAAVYGVPAQEAALMAQDEINRSGGINGRPLQLISEDGKCDGKAAASAASKLISVDKVKVIVGGHCSTESVVMAPIAEKAKVVMLASITSAPSLTTAGDYIFRNSPASDLMTPPSAHLALQKGFRTVAALYEQKDFPQGQFSVFKREFEAGGGRVVSAEGFASGTNDLRTQLIKIDRLHPDAIFFAPQASDAAVAFLTQMKELGLLDKYPVVAGVLAVSKDVDNKTGGLLNTSRIFTTDGYVSPDANPLSKKVLDSFSARYGGVPPINSFFIGSSYDAIYLIKEALVACGGDGNTACLRDHLYAVKDRIGAAGSLTLDKNGDAQTPIALHYFDEKGNEVWTPIK